MPFLAAVDANIWWESIGTGDPVVLINGLGSPSATWFRLARLLESDYTVITCDNRGTGRTVAPSAPHSVSTMAGDVAAVVAAAGHARAHVIGHSMGGLIAQELALAYPDVVRSLVLASTHVGLPHAAPYANPVAAVELTAAASVAPEDRAPAMRSLLYWVGTSQQAILEDEAVRAAHPTTEEGYRNQLLGASHWQRYSDLTSLTVPTLVIHGADDRIVPAPAGEQLAAAIPGAQFELYRDAGHALFTDKTDLVAQTIKGFLNQQKVSA